MHSSILIDFMGSTLKGICNLINFLHIFVDKRIIIWAIFFNAVCIKIIHTKYIILGDFHGSC